MLVDGLLIGWRLHWGGVRGRYPLDHVRGDDGRRWLGEALPLDDYFSIAVRAAGAAFLLAALTCTTSPRTGLEFAVPARAG